MKRIKKTSVNCLWKKPLVVAIAGLLPLAASAKDYDLEAKSLTKALLEFSQASDVHIIVPPKGLEGLQSTGLQGDFSVEQGLLVLLKDSGMTYRKDQNNVYVVYPDTNSNGDDGAVKKSLESSKNHQMEEITVTATKRETSLQDTAISITAIGSEEIESRGLIGMADYLNSVPSVTFHDGGVGRNQIVIRGIATKRREDATVGSYFGEVPLTSPLSGIQGSVSTDLKLVDMERVEVLRGPQGTLYGNGAMGGLIRNIPKAPNLNEIEGTLEIGSGFTARSDDDNTKLVGVLNIPLVENKLAARLVAYRFEQAGYVDWVSTPLSEGGAARTGTQVDLAEDAGNALYRGARASLLWQPTERFQASLLLATQTLELDGDAAVDVALGGYRNSFVRGPRQFREEEVDIANLVLDYEFDWATLTSSTAYLDGRLDRQFTTNAAYAAFTEEDAVAGAWLQPKSSFVQEVRLATQFEGPLQFVVGGYYQEFDSTIDTAFDWFGTRESYESISWITPYLGTDGSLRYLESSDILKLEQKALFGELTYELTDELEFAVGGRWFEYDRSAYRPHFLIAGFIFPQGEPNSNNEKDSTYKLSMRWSPADEVTLYSQWAQGFRAAGANSPFPEHNKPTCDTNNDGILDGTNVPLNPELVSDRTDNYEVGGKFQLLDRRLMINTTAFQINWYDFPVSVFADTVACLSGVTASAGEVQSRGLEVESKFFATPNLQLLFSASYANIVTQDDFIAPKGTRLPMSPRFNGMVGLHYDFDFAGHPGFVRTDYTYVGGFGTSIQSVNSVNAGDYGKWNVRAGIDLSSQWQIAVYGTNLTNEDALVTADLSILAANGYRVPPRVIGFDLKYQF